MATVSAAAGYEAARIAGESAEMDRIAEEMKVRAEVIGAAHDDKGTFTRLLRVRNIPAIGHGTVRQRFVETTDPEGVAKEFGHLIRNRDDGPILGRVRGQHTLQKTIDATPRDDAGL